MAKAELPFGIDASRHRDLEGRSHHVWMRRAALTVAAALPVLGLINVFGQRSQVASYSDSAAAIKVISPAHIRGGLLFTTEIVITPREGIHDAHIRLGNGWFNNMTVNAVTPQPSNESAMGNLQDWDFGPMSADVAFHVWIAWQTNPTNFGPHTQTIALYDGSTRLVSGRRTVTVFP